MNLNESYFMIGDDGMPSMNITESSEAGLVGVVAFGDLLKEVAAIPASIGVSERVHFFAFF